MCRFNKHKRLAVVKRIIDVSFPLREGDEGKVIYMQSNKIHRVFLMTKFYSSHMLARHVSALTGPSSGAFIYKLYV